MPVEAGGSGTRPQRDPEAAGRQPQQHRPGPGQIRDPGALARLRTVSRVIADSPALLAREQQAVTRTAAALAALLAAEAGTPGGTGTPADDLRPQVAANALLGLHRALIDYVRRRVLADDEPKGLAADVRRLTAEAFALLEHGLRDYAARPSVPAGGPR